MDRYSTIRGTVKSGAEMRLKESAGLSEFLQSQGALDANSVLQVIDTQLRGFERLTGYETEMQNQKPVAVRYAPMHLYKMRGMERMRPFCALSVNGVENRDDRISHYSQTFVFSHQQMVQGKGGYNYLDMLFGTELLSWKTLELYRANQASLECDTPLRKITPKIEAHDLTMVLKTVEAIYQKKNVVIRLQPNLSFNDRSMSLLAGIYSLLQPRLAVEVGYASYQRAADIAKIVERNSIRIFVLPAGEALDQISDNFVILDMAKGPVPVQKTPLMETLVKWIQLPWEQRQSAMQHLFKDERDYQDEALFVQKSNDFFRDMGLIEAWRKDASKNGTITGIEELYAEYEAQPSQNIPWFEQLFRAKISSLIGKQNTVDKLNAQTAVKLYTTTDEEQKQAQKMYQFGRKFGNVDVGSLCQLVSEHQKSEDAKVHAEEVAAMNAGFQQEKAAAAATLLRVQSEAAVALAAEQENTRQAVAAGNAAVAAEQEKAAAALAAEQEKTRKAVADGIAAVNAANASAAAALAQAQEAARMAVEAEKANTRRAVEEGEAAVAAEQAKTAAVLEEKAQLHAKATAAFKEERSRTQAARTELEQEQAAHRQTRANADALVQEKQTLQQNLQHEQRTVNKLQQDLTNMKLERDEARSQISGAESRTRQAQADRNAMQSERDAANAAAQEAREKLDNYKHGKYNTRLIATGGIAGLLAGALLVGGIWLGTFLLNRNKEPVVPETTVAPLVETTVPETTAAETVPAETTPAETAPTADPTATIPDTTAEADLQALEVSMDPAVLPQLPALIPMVKTVRTDGFEAWIPETILQNPETTVLALLSTADALPEEAEAADFSYALLVESHVAAADAPEAAEEVSEETENTSEETENTSEETENISEAADVVSADLTLSAGAYSLLVFGDEPMQYAALQAFDCLIPGEAPVSVSRGGDNPLDLNGMMLEMLEDTDWWRKVEYFSALAPEAGITAVLTATDLQPALYLCCNGCWVCLYDCADAPEQLEALNALATETYRVVQQGSFVALASTAEMIA